jgi:hypothetical protein
MCDVAFDVADVGDSASADPEVPIQPLADREKRGEGRMAVTSREPVRHCGSEAPADVAHALDHLKRTSR